LDAAGLMISRLALFFSRLSYRPIHHVKHSDEN